MRDRQGTSAADDHPITRGTENHPGATPTEASLSLLAHAFAASIEQMMTLEYAMDARTNDEDRTAANSSFDSLRFIGEQLLLVTKHHVDAVEAWAPAATAPPTKSSSYVCSGKAPHRERFSKQAFRAFLSKERSRVEGAMSAAVGAAVAARPRDLVRFVGAHLIAAADEERAQLSRARLLHDTDAPDDEAEPQLREALADCRSHLGDQHDDTLVAIKCLSTLLQAQGRLVEAEDLMREALQSHLDQLGDRHPTYLGMLHDLGSLLNAKGELEEAESLLTEALRTRRVVLGDQHGRTLDSLHSLGVVLCGQGRHAEAEPLVQELVQTSLVVLGDGHPDTHRARAKLRTIRSAIG